MQKLNALPLLGCLALLACDEADPVELIPLPDAAPRPDAAPVRDAAVHDASDAERDAADASDAEHDAADASEDASDVETDAAETDADEDGSADSSADASEDASADAEVSKPERVWTQLLSGRQDAVLAFVRSGHLWQSSLAPNEQPREPMDLGELPELQDWSPETAFLGGRTTSGPAWIFLPEGENGELMARNLSSAPSSPVKTNLYPPARIAVGSEILLIGHSAPDPTSPIAWSIIASSGPEARTVDPSGMPLPVSATPGLTGWIFAFEDGQCWFLNSLENPVESWNCHALPDSVVLAGNTNAFHAAAFDSELAFWSAMPSAAEDPNGASSYTPFAQGATVEGQFPVSNGGVAYALTAPDARIWVATKEGAYALPLPKSLDAADVLGLVQNRGAWRAISWDSDADLLVATDLTQSETQLPPSFSRRDTRCMTSIEPEDCSDSDRDCDGYPRQGLCCASSTVHTGAQLESVRIDEPFYAAMSDDGLLLAVPAAGKASLYSLQVGNASGTANLLAVWDDVSRITGFAHWLTRSILRAEFDVESLDEAGETQISKEESLLWFLGADQAVTTDIPCDMKYFRVKDAEGRARFFCEDKAEDHEPGAALGTPVAYPTESGGGALRWATPRALGEEDLILVALGEGYALELWRDGETLTRDVELESAIAMFKDLATDQRAYPIQLTKGALPARVVNQHVEIFRENVGFVQSSGSSWPVQAFISAYDPIALSVGYDFDPATLASATQNSLKFYSHDLRPGASSSGRVASLNRSNSNAQPTFRGLALGDYSASSGLPILIRGYGTNSTLIEAFTLSCGDLGESTEDD